ncbi:uncharacterized protein LOC127258566 isoform X3 [Andrographis paniculata]|uniref:uncharacterized protein LOC127258566 isoform X3 n=1 Tax=Andrographis paniculata TaxID=175694 RepID=UPI0021E7641F|nr:uncharacterized protein LOC127258566 isoform X3 [Andrographis paniculata]
MREEDINRCQIQDWYPKFSSVSIKTIIHELPESFIQYLLDDSGTFLLPHSITNDDALPNRVHKPEDEEDFVALEGSENEAEEPTLPPSFPELETAVKASIESLGGAVFPKLNWSAPKDAAWISSTGNLKCTNLAEIALLLKSSDSIVHDLCHAYDSCVDSKTSLRPAKFCLALRKWHPSLKPEMEFRCFVRSNVLLAICQREVTNLYPALIERIADLKARIHDFFLEEVKGSFESERYTFDVYVRKDFRVKLLDFNLWGAPTLPLLFTWDELEEMPMSGSGDGELEFRIAENRCIRPGLKTAVPFDYLDTSPGSGWDQFLKNAEEELKHQTSESNMEPLVITKGRYTYVHDVKNGGSKAIDVHHIIHARSSASILMFCRYAILLSILCIVVVLYLQQEKFAINVIWILIVAGLFLRQFERKKVEKETVTIFPTFGVQLQTSYRGGRTVCHFVPIGKILKPVLNECVTPVTCYWSLSLILRGEEQLLLVFKESYPPVAMLVPIWKALCTDIDDKECRDGHS